MKARRFLERSVAFGPKLLVVIIDAFEDAWREVSAAYEDGDAREAARMRLAMIALELAQDGIADGQCLKALAVEAMRQPLN